MLKSAIEVRQVSIEAAKKLTTSNELKIIAKEIEKASKTGETYIEVDNLGVGVKLLLDSFGYSTSETFHATGSQNETKISW